ncbi:DUF4162 domain-containing protein [Exiguobacterium sp. s133]|nr:DUF4162 domain-containing protein [Exiguobacterium sp. s133]
MTNGLIAKIGTIAQLKRVANETIRVHLRTSPSLDTSILQHCKINDIRFIKHEQDFAVVEVKEEEGIPLLIEQLTAARIKVYEVNIEAMSLEDVFMTV